MVSDLKTFADKGCKIAAQQNFCFSANFAFIAGFFWYWCYYSHWLRDALSPICKIFKGNFSKSFIFGKPKLKHKKVIFKIWIELWKLILQTPCRAKININIKYFSLQCMPSVDGVSMNAWINQCFYMKLQNTTKWINYIKTRRGRPRW